MKVNDGNRIKIRVERIDQIAVVIVSGEDGEVFKFGIDAQNVISDQVGDIQILEIEGIGRELPAAAM